MNIVAHVTSHVKAAGEIALEEQRAMSFSDRTYKADNSVVTEADRRVESFLVNRISALHPTANLITEETRRPFDPQRAPTFAIDPIDGTDVFSQGMPGWCVSVGLLDQDLIPVGGVIFAPRLDLLIVADVGDGATLNGSPLRAPQPPPSISVRSNLMVTSRIHKQLDLSGYVGKIRGIGSAALHLCYPLIYPAVIGALEGPGVHIWDIAAAHAVNRALGQDLSYLNAHPIDYVALVDGGPGADVVMAGCGSIVQALRDALKRLPPDSEPSRD
jgi:myo-inositol-1(or 4)-monophosphatase